MTRDVRLKRADVAAFGRPSKRFHGALFSLSVAPLPPVRQWAYACIVSKRVAGKATHRNRIKRRCREAARRSLKEFPPQKPAALVFRAKEAAGEATFADIDADVRALVDKIARTGYNLSQ
ncbi:ribonuclease P protein component [Candidatus Kaiserbacteria bacterium]|nr:ribonuclease P protein component [Candidatus Kaiserbacteria bacterium]